MPRGYPQLGDCLSIRIDDNHYCAGVILALRPEPDGSTSHLLGILGPEVSTPPGPDIFREPLTVAGQAWIVPFGIRKGKADFEVVSRMLLSSTYAENARTHGSWNELPSLARHLLR